MLLKNNIFNDVSLFCFVVFESEELDYEVIDDGDLLYNGSVNIFKTLGELNNYLADVKIENIMLNNVYKGYLFKGTHFPLDSNYKNPTTLILENIGDSKYFVEQVENPKLAADLIQNDVNKLPNITDYMVFLGKHINLSLYCNERN